MTAERVRDGTEEIFTIRLSAARVNTENGNELPRPSHKCYLRAARRRRQGRSPQGRAQREPWRGRAQLDADHVMAEATSTETEISVESAVHSVRDLRRVRNEQRTCKRRTDRSPFRWRLCDTGTGREQPSGPASGRQWVQNRGVAHAPTPSVTPAKCVSCAAKNAALVVLPQLASRRLREPPSSQRYVSERPRK